MNYLCHYHHHSEKVSKAYSEWDELKIILNDISEKEVVDLFNLKKNSGSKPSSISPFLNEIIKNKLLEKGWKKETKIFSEPYYNKEKAFRLDFSKNKISLEVGFNHSGSICWNIIKPFLASQLNHVKKEIQTDLAVIITATKEFKSNGGYDGAIGTYEDYIAYLKPLAMFTMLPIIIIGFTGPLSFKVSKNKIDGRNIASIIET